MDDEQSRRSAKGSSHRGSSTESDAAEGGGAQLVLVFSREPAPHAGPIRLGNDLLLIGRVMEDGAGIATGDPRMSRVHVRILPDRRASNYRITDVHSRNGTFVNGQRIESAALHDADVIRIGDSVFVYSERDPMQAAMALTERFAASEPVVLVEGEPGTGRQRLALTLHALSGRADAFVKRSAATLGAELSLAALLAYDGGTSAANGGSLVLDDIDACPAEGQAGLLRALEQQALERQPGAPRMGVIACSSSSLAAACANTSFSPELYQRLARARIELPALRARRTELIGLLEALAAAPDEPQRKTSVSLQLNADAAEAITLGAWPGNLNDMRKLLAAAADTRPGQALDMAALAELAPQLTEAIVNRKRMPRPPAKL